MICANQVFAQFFGSSFCKSVNLLNQLSLHDVTSDIKVDTIRNYNNNTISGILPWISIEELVSVENTFILKEISTKEFLAW